MKKLVSLFLTAALLLTALLLVSCGGKTPSQVLTDELEKLRSGEIFEDGDTSLTDEDMEMQKRIYENMKYTVGEEKISGDTATVALEITVVDMQAVFTKYLSEAMAHMGEEDWDADGKVMLDILAAADAPTTTKNVTVNMVKTDGSWTVAEENNDDFLNAVSGGLFGYLNEFGSDLEH